VLYQLSYSHHKVVGVEGFEPPTSCSQSRRATRLRYTPTTEGTALARRAVYRHCEGGAMRNKTASLDA
jgi:hypothetical protein